MKGLARIARKRRGPTHKLSVRSCPLLEWYQKDLACAVILTPMDDVGNDLVVCGVDVSYRDSAKRAWVGGVSMRLSDLEMGETVSFEVETEFPYIPGLMCFREGPLVVEAVKRLTTTPDIVLVDGHGIAHPRRFGLACYVGFITGIPTIGCAKSVLLGQMVDVYERSCDGSYLVRDQRGEMVGAAIEVTRGLKPIIVSPGHLIDLVGAIEVVRNCSKGYRLPEPLRLAHLLSRKAMRGLYCHSTKR